MKKAYCICLDPGHGPGCPNGSPDGTYEEQEFAMDLAERIARLLRAAGVEVMLTRDHTRFPSLEERCKLANAKEGLALFVSIHSNAAGAKGWSEARGHLIFTSGGEKTQERNRAAQAILKRWEEALVPLGPSPLRHEAYTVLLRTAAPAVLLEHGFHTNREEVERLKDKDFRQHLAEADAEGILDYLGISREKTENPDRARVKARFALQEETLDYLEAYRFGGDLLRKLSEGR